MQSRGLIPYHRYIWERLASALERAGIQTERGNVNRRIMEQNKAILTAKMLVAKAEEQLQKLVNSKPVEAVRNTANEVLDMIRAVVGKKGRLELPVIKSKYLRKISQRQSLQEQERMERFVVANQIESFEQLQEFKTQREPAYKKLSAERQQIAEQIARLEQLLVAYSDYEPYIVYHKTSNSLKGFANPRYVPMRSMPLTGESTTQHWRYGKRDFQNIITSTDTIGKAL